MGSSISGVWCDYHKYKNDCKLLDIKPKGIRNDFYDHWELIKENLNK